MTTGFLQTTDVRSLVDLARRRAADAPDRAAYIWLDGGREVDRLTYRELDRRARALAATVAEGGAPGERALLLFPPGLDFVAAFLGCLYAGVVAVPAYPPRRNRGMDRLNAIVADTRPRWVLTTEKPASRIRPWMEGSGLPKSAMPRLVVTDTVDPNAASAWTDPGIGPDDLAFLQYTSGSTSTPKGVRVAHGHLLHNEEMIRQAFGQSERSVIVSWLPLYHDMGLIGGVLQPLYLGARCILMSPFSFLQNPKSWLDAISDYRATTSGGPDFGYGLCVRKIDEASREGLDLSSWTVAFNGSEPVRPETLEAFTHAFAPCGFRASAHYPCYGLAEATLFVTGGGVDAPPPIRDVSASALERHRMEPVSDAASDDRRRLVGCGRAWSDQELAVVDPETRSRLPDGRVGEIWISGPSVADGYWNRPDRTEEEFRATILGESGETAGAGDRVWLRTGDLGFLDGSELFVTGRLKDLIILRGRNYYPHDFERTAEAVHAALRPGCGAAFSIEAAGEERLVLVQEVDKRFAARAADEEVAQIAEAVRQAVAEEHEVAVHEVVLVEAGQVPKTSSGKVRRGRCRELYEDDGLEVPARTGASPRAAAPERVDSVTSSDAVDAADAKAPSLGVSRDDLEFLDDDERLPILKLHLRRAVARIVGVPAETVDARTPLTALGVDSLASMELVHAVESSLDVELPLADLLEGPTATELARTLLERLASGTRASTTIDTAPVGGASEGSESELPLSYGQRALWFLHRLAPAGSAYHIAAAFTVTRGWDGEAFERACRALIRRHPALRTTFHAPADLAGEPTQRIRPEGDLDLESRDGSAWTVHRVRDWMAEETARPFDLESGPLFRVRLLTEGDAGVTVLVVIHHVAADFWSMGVLARDLGRALAGDDLGTEPAEASYAAHQAAERARLDGDPGDRLWKYWQARLAGASAELELPTDRPRPRVQTHSGAAVRRTLPAETASSLRSLARSRGATPYVVLLAVFGAVLHRITGQSDLTVGSPTAGRGDRRFADTVGYFVNPVALRSEVVGDPDFGDHLETTRRRVAEALDHADLPLPLLAERLRPERDAARSPLFQALFVHHRAAMAEEGALASLAVGREGVVFRLGPLEAVSRTVPDRAAQFDVSLAVAEVGDDVHATLTYNTDLFDAATARRLLDSFESLAAGAGADPDRRLTELPLQTPAQWVQVTSEWSKPPAVPTDERTPIRRVLDQAAATPDAPALWVGEDRWTYAELVARAGRVAAALRDRGVEPEERVGVLLPRTGDLVAAILGVWRAGGAYVPIDPAYPEERKRFMLEDSGARWVVTDGDHAGEIGDARALVIDTPSTEPMESDSPEPLEGPRHLAYVIYTSGSTGRPKGVAIEHAGAAALLDWARTIYGPEERAGVLAATSVCFDLSVFELFLPLTTGGTVILADHAPALADLPRRDSVTLVNTVPSAAAELLAAKAFPASVRTVNLAGEPLLGDLAARIYATGTVERLYNLYGPSEDTTYSTWSRVEKNPQPGVEPTIGRPVAGTRAYVLDPAGRPRPVGVSGELCLGGRGLARGYLGRPSKTAEAWVPDPFAGPAESGGRLYRTGDRVRWLPTGELEFLGRFDHQIKLRGYRIELGEVETALTALPEVDEAVVGVRGDVLAAFVVPRETLETRERRAAYFDTLRRTLTSRLPSYMVPSVGAVLDAMPRTPNGKVDRKALASLDVTAPGDAAALGEIGDAGRVPETETERVLADLWGRVLDRPPVAADQNVFALGAHSLTATRVASRLPEELGVELPLSAFFEAHTVAEQAARVEAARQASTPTVDDAVGPVTPVTPVPRDGDLPLSYAQERLWFLERLEPGSAVYHVVESLDLDGDLSPAALGAALDGLVRRHESLRTVFPERDGEPRQQVMAPRSRSRPVVDVSRPTPTDRDAALERLGHRYARQPFDLLRGPVFGAVLVRRETRDHGLWVRMHHAVTDGWSLGILARELKTFYAAARSGEPHGLPEPALHYADYAAWQRRTLTPDVLERRLDAWRERLAGAPPVLDLPTDRPRPAEASPEGDRVELRVPADLARRLHALTSRGTSGGGTPFMGLLAVWGTFLGRLSRQADLVVGTPVAHRTRPEVEEIPGFFVNTLALRMDLGGRPSFRELLDRVRRTAVDAFEHQDVPFEVLVQDLAPERSLAASPLFQAFFVLQNAPLEPLELPGLTLTRRPVPTGTTHFDVTLELSEDDLGEGLVGVLGTRRDLFDRTTALRWAGHFRRLLEAAVETPDRPVTALPWLSPAERHQALVGWGRAASPTSDAQKTPVHRRFDAQARHTPDAVAVEDGDVHWTYGHLERVSGGLARRLRSRGVGPDVPVGVRLPRGPERLAAVLGVVRAGGACLPLDPSYPDDRLAFMTADAGAPVTITESWFRDDSGEPRAMADEIPVPADALLYLIYTSGSTGRPKGVGLPHRALANLMAWQDRQWTDRSGKPAARTLQFAPMSFDVFFQELFHTWGAGGVLVLVDDDLRRDAHALWNRIVERRVERLFLPFVALHGLAEAAEDSVESSALAEVATAGEQLRSTPPVRALFARSGARLVNQYGPSEAHVVSAHDLDRDPVRWPDLPGIGRPVDGLDLPVLDGEGAPVPPGVVGELYIGGVALARGYVGRPARTADAFRPDGSTGRSGTRLYRTGDLARWTSRGELEFLGRADDQVKIRGHRVEPGEVETVLAAAPGVADAVVAVRGEDARRRLVAWVTAADPASPPSAAGLRTHLQERLPAYMTPSVFTVLEAFPLTPSGKVDRRSLPEPEAGAAEPGEAPRTPAEELVAGVFREVLDVESIGRGDSFFDLGGHSLLATRAAARLRKRFGVEVPVKTLFGRPTVAELARELTEARRTREGSPALGPPPLTTRSPVLESEPVPTFAQERMWFLDRLASGADAFERAAYNLSGGFRVRAALSGPALEAALTALTARHAVLRTRFEDAGGRPRLHIEPLDPMGSVRVTVPAVDLSGLSAADRRAEAAGVARREALTPLDLSRPPLLRARHVVLAPADRILRVSVHHAAADGWSLGLILRDVGDLYGDAVAGRPPDLTPPEVSYADYAAWQRDWARDGGLEAALDAWKTRLRGLEPLDLPTDRPRSESASFRGGERPLRLSPRAVDALEELGRRAGATPFMVWTAAFQTLLARWSGQADLAVGTPTAGRTLAEFEDVVGCFVNTLVLRSRVVGTASFVELLDQVRETALEAFALGDVPFERVVDTARPDRDPRRSPLFQAFLALENTPKAIGELGGAPVEEIRDLRETTRFDLTLALREVDGDLTGGLNYRTSLFDATTIERFARALERLPDEVTRFPDAPLESLDLLSPAERHAVLHEIAAEDPATGDATDSYAAFLAQAAERPDAVALAAGSREVVHLTYGALEAWSGRIARALGDLPGPEPRVGVRLERFPELPASLLAVWRVGAVYVPLDPSYPTEQLRLRADDAGLVRLLTPSTLTEASSTSSSADVPRPRPVDPAHLGHVFYTSGSTGRPKGVAVSRGALGRHLAGLRRRYGLAPGERMLQFAAPSFDASLNQIVGPLTAGACIVLTDPGVPEPRELGRRLLEEQVTRVNLPPAYLDQLLAKAEGVGPLPAATRWIASGDRLPPETVERFRRSPWGAARLLNGYGPTEGTVTATLHAVASGERGRDAGKPVPIGRPFPGRRVVVLDPSGRPAAPGVFGELCLAEPPLARGYLGRPARTAEVFVPDAHGLPGARLYRTGDRVRLLASGDLEIRGRLDRQVQIRGFRVEPGEVEAVLEAHPSVRRAAVDVRPGPTGDPRLVAFWVRAEAVTETETDSGETVLRAHLAERLPSYMHPAAYRTLDDLPRTPGGKVDRRALAAVEVSRGGDSEDRDAAYVAPRDAVETRLVEIFQDLLGVERVGVHDDFFAMGGHSLLATQAVSRIRDDLGAEVPLRRFFEAPTAAETAAGIGDGAGRVFGAPETDDPITPREDDGPAPLSPAQERLWILDRLEPGNAAYNVPAAVRLTGRLDSTAWDGALRELVRRHEILRTVFAVRDGRPVQVIEPQSDVALPRVDLSGLDPDARGGATARLVARESARPFDLARGPLARFIRLRLSDGSDGDGEQAFLLNLHHIVTDGWSMALLVREVGTLYGAYREGRPSPLPEPRVQYADYAVWQRRRLTGERLERQVEYWRETLAGAPPGLDLPTDRPRPAVRTFRGAWRKLELPGDLADALRRRAREERASLFMILLAAFDLVASRWAGEEDVLVGTPVAGRVRSETESLLGFFLNSLVLRVDLSGRPTFRELLGRVRETALAAYAHQDLPFERLLEELDVPRELSRTPLFSIFFNMVNVPFGRASLPGLEMEPLHAPDALSKFDMTLYAREVDEPEGSGVGLIFDVAYDAHLYSEERMDAFLEQYRFLLEQAAANPDRPVDAYSLDPEARAVCLPDPRRPLDASWPGSVRELFLEHARRAPDAEAVCDPTGTWTYGDLDRASARLARELVRVGVGREDPVAIYAHRSAVLVPAVFGVLRAGGAFVMLDPAYPPTRLIRMLEPARPKAFIHLTAAGELPGELGEHLAGSCPVLELPSWSRWDVGESFAAPDPPVSPDDLAYISFTSGSTGMPKGILGRQGPLTHFLPWQAERFGLGPGDRYSLLSGLAHDPLQRDLFTALCLGGAVVVPDPTEIFAAGRLARWMRREEVTVAHLTPAMGQVLAEMGPDGPVTAPSLRWVLLVGDALTRRDVARLERLGPNARCVNLYGSTETQRAVGHHVVERGGTGEDKEILPLGRGMPDVQLLVLNAAGERAAVGELGEIAVRSPHLARGYLDDPERTRERFTPNPWSDDPADRLYRTGDLGRYRPDGEVVFAGRADTQVQVRGFRIELSEIEGELGRLDGVREAVVLAKGRAADRRLIAWVVPDPDRDVDVAELRRSLAERLPGYMVPAQFVPLDALPLTPNGKVDRRNLLARDDTPREGTEMHRDPETETERLIARLIGEALDAERIGIDDNFFDLGANSLLLVQVHGRLEEALERKIPAVDLFSHPTVRELAAHLGPSDVSEGSDDGTEPDRGTDNDAPDRSERLKAGRARLAARRRRRK